MCSQIFRAYRRLFVGLLAVGLAAQATAQDAPGVRRAVKVVANNGEPVSPPAVTEVKPAGGNPIFYNTVVRPNSGDWVRMFGAVPKKVRASYLGVSTSRLTAAMRSQLSLPAGVGLVVDVVDKDGPGAMAGLKQYDVLHKLNDQILVNLEQLSVLVRTFKPGDEVTLTVIRQAKPTTLTAKLIEKEIDDMEAVETLYGRTGATQEGGGGGGGGGTVRAMPANQDYNWKVLTVPNLGGYLGASANIAGSITYNDDEHSIQITLDKGQPRLVATDKNGKEVFKGPIATQADLKAVPEAIRKKLELLHARIGAGGSGAGGVGLSSGTRRRHLSRAVQETSQSQKPKSRNKRRTISPGGASDGSEKSGPLGRPVLLFKCIDAEAHFSAP